MQWFSVLIMMGTLLTAMPVFANTAQELLGLGDLMQIYVLKPDRRSPEDKVVLKPINKGQYAAEISYWRSLKTRDAAEEVCNAYKWILAGRGSYAKGAAEAFDKYPDLAQISLRFFDIEHGTTVGRKTAEILPTQKLIPYLRVSISRNNFASYRARLPKIIKDLKGKACPNLGKSYMDSTWFDETYLRQVQ